MTQYFIITAYFTIAFTLAHYQFKYCIPITIFIAKIAYTLIITYILQRGRYDVLDVPTMNFTNFTINNTVNFLNYVRREYL